MTEPWPPLETPVWLAGRRNARRGIVTAHLPGGFVELAVPHFKFRRDPRGGAPVRENVPSIELAPIEALFASKEAALASMEAGHVAQTAA